MSELRRAVASSASFPAVLFVYRGFISDGERFFARFWPRARAIADYEKRLYTAFGLGRASFWQLFGPRVWLPALSTMAKGYFMGKPVGDIRLLPGAFLVKNHHVIWEHRPRHIGDLPDLQHLEQPLEREGG